MQQKDFALLRVNNDMLKVQIDDNRFLYIAAVKARYKVAWLRVADVGSLKMFCQNFPTMLCFNKTFI